jgi:hypothetical protein
MNDRLVTVKLIISIHLMAGKNTYTKYIRGVNGHEIPHYLLSML